MEGGSNIFEEEAEGAEQDTITVHFTQTPGLFGNEAATTALTPPSSYAPLQNSTSSPTESSRLGFILVGAGATSLFLVLALMLLWYRDKEKYARKYDGQSNKKVVPLPVGHEMQVVVVEEEVTDDDDDDEDDGMVWRLSHFCRWEDSKDSS